MPTPLKNMSSSDWIIIPTIGEKKIHVLNHQPDDYLPLYNHYNYHITIISHYITIITILPWLFTSITHPFLPAIRQLNPFHRHLLLPWRCCWSTSFSGWLNPNVFHAVNSQIPQVDLVSPNSQFKSRFSGKKSRFLRNINILGMLHVFLSKTTVGCVRKKYDNLKRPNWPQFHRENCDWPCWISGCSTIIFRYRTHILMF